MNFIEFYSIFKRHLYFALRMVIYLAFYLDVTQGHMNGGYNACFIQIQTFQNSNISFLYDERILFLSDFSSS